MKQQPLNPFDNLGEQLVNISKAHAFDIVSEQVKDLLKENEQLKKETDRLYHLASSEMRKADKLEKEVKILRQTLLAARSDYNFDGIISEQTAEDISAALSQTETK